MGAFSAGNVRTALSTASHSKPITATTPHGTYTFDIVEVTVHHDGSAVLHLQEQKPEGEAEA